MYVLCTLSLFLSRKPKLNKAVQTWGLVGRITACVYDTAKNIVASNNATPANWHFVPCFVPTLHLALN